MADLGTREDLWVAVLGAGVDISVAVSGVAEDTWVAAAGRGEDISVAG